MAMGAIYKLKYKSIAQGMAAQDGKNWDELDEREKEMYFSKAYQNSMDKQTTRPAGKKPTNRY